MMACAIESLHLPELQKLTNRIKILMQQLYAPTHRGSVCPLVFLKPTTYLPHIQKILTHTPPAGPESAFLCHICSTLSGSMQSVVEQVAHRAWNWEAQAPS